MFKTFFSIFLLVLVAQPFTVHSFQKTETIEKSYEAVTVTSARKYLKALGYLQDKNNDANMNNKRDNHKVDNNPFDEDLEASIKKFQQYYNLEVSGKLDSETTKLMSSPRCGVADTEVKTFSRFGFFQGKPKWPSSKRHLTYAFKTSVEYVPLEVQRRVFREAFRQWSLASPFTFSEVRRGSGSDITIGFLKGEHGDGVPFEKWGAMLGHAFKPTDGRIHVNAEELWSDEVPIGRRYFDLVWIAMHEIGHVLGLDHSPHAGSVMYAYAYPGENMRKLSADDVVAIRDLYSLTDYTHDSHAPRFLYSTAILFSFCFHFFYLVL